MYNTLTEYNSDTVTKTFTIQREVEVNPRKRKTTLIERSVHVTNGRLSHF